MNPIQIILTTAKFEIRNCATTRRLAVSALLALFPPTMLFLILFSSTGPAVDFNLVICIFVFMVGLLSLLLWATPNVYAEMESRGWIYLTSRSYGRVGMLVGKYVAAVLNSWLICVASMTLCLLLGDSMAAFPQPMSQLWIGYVALITLSSIAYGAIYSLIGVIFQKRAMVIGAIYTMVSDLMLANIPALISKLTVRYYVHGLALKWLDIDVMKGDMDTDVAMILEHPSDLPSYLQVIGLLAITALIMGVAIYVIRYREYVTSDET